MPVTTIDTIPAMPEAPTRTNPTAFPGLADTWMASWTGTTDELNTMIAALNTYADEIEDYYDDTETAKTAAETAQGAAETAQALAEDWAEKETEVESGKNSSKTWANIAQSAVAQGDYTGLSTNSITIGLGSKTCTIETGKSFVANQFVTIIDIDDNSNWIAGFITSYTTSTGILIITSEFENNNGFVGSNWIISLSSPTLGGTDVQLDFKRSFLL